jgi:hypothetical protein
MSLLGKVFDTVVGLGKTALNFVQSNNTAGTILKTVLTGYALNKVTNSIKKENAAPTAERAQLVTIDPGVRLQVPPAQDEKVPVVYGQAQLGGIITEAVMDQNNSRMTYVLTICEQTGVKLSDDQMSVFDFLDVYYFDQRIVFKSSGSGAGVVADRSVDRDGNQDLSIQDLVQVYCYAGNSNSPVAPVGYTNNSLPAAYTVVPGWSTSHTMDQLIFAVVQVTYSREKGVTRLPDMRFHVRNSMTLPGDCMLDYMTNTRYGAGIPAEEIYSE